MVSDNITVPNKEGKNGSYEASMFYEVLGIKDNSSHKISSSSQVLKITSSGSFFNVDKVLIDRSAPSSNY